MGRPKRSGKDPAPLPRRAAVGDVVAWRSDDGWRLGKITGRNIEGLKVVLDGSGGAVKVLPPDELHVVDQGRRSEFDALLGRLGGDVAHAA